MLPYLGSFLAKYASAHEYIRHPHSFEGWFWTLLNIQPPPQLSLHQDNPGQQTWSCNYLVILLD